MKRKTKSSKRKAADSVAGAAIGAAIAGPLGAVVGGLAARHVESGLEQARKLQRRTARTAVGADDPVIHARLKRILVPLDFSPPSKRALRFAKEWAVLFGAEVCLLRVLEPTLVVAEFGTVPMGAVRGDVASRAKAALESLARAEFPQSIRVTVGVRKGAPYDQIVAAAKDIGADVIIIPTHGRTGLKRVLLGSTAERVARHAPCPVLILRRSQTPRI